MRISKLFSIWNINADNENPFSANFYDVPSKNFFVKSGPVAIPIILKEKCFFEDWHVLTLILDVYNVSFLVFKVNIWVYRWWNRKFNQFVK